MGRSATPRSRGRAAVEGLGLRRFAVDQERSRADRVGGGLDARIASLTSARPSPLPLPSVDTQPRQDDDGTGYPGIPFCGRARVVGQFHGARREGVVADDTALAPARDDADLGRVGEVGLEGVPAQPGGLGVDPQSNSSVRWLFEIASAGTSSLPFEDGGRGQERGQSRQDARLAVVAVENASHSAGARTNRVWLARTSWAATSADWTTNSVMVCSVADAASSRAARRSKPSSRLPATWPTPISFAFGRTGRSRTTRSLPPSSSGY